MRGYVIRGVLFLCLMVGLAVWAATYDGPADDPAPAAATSPPQRDSSVAAAPGPTADRRDAGTPAVPRRAAAPRADGGLADSDPSPKYPGLTVAQARQRDAVIDAARRRSAENDARFEQYQRTWESERRDAAWAKATEDDLRQLMIDSEVDHMLVDLVCHDTICRMRTDVPDSHSAITLVAVPGLLDAFGGEERSAIRTEQGPDGQVFTWLGPVRQPD